MLVLVTLVLVDHLSIQHSHTYSKCGCANDVHMVLGEMMTAEREEVCPRALRN